jgi:hypothetical protein
VREVAAALERVAGIAREATGVLEGS